MNIVELTAAVELSEKLTRDDIKKIQTLIRASQVMCQNVSDVPLFLSDLRQWNQHNPVMFYKALNDTRPDLIETACRIPWLCASHPAGYGEEREELTIKSLIDLLKNEITKSNWILIYMAVAGESRENIGFEITLNKMLEMGFIDRDLKIFSDVLKGINRIDLLNKLRAYQSIFSTLEEGEFESKFIREVGTQAKEMIQWEHKLKQFSKTQHEIVKQIIGSDETVNLAYVYIDLTILKQKPQPINLDDETTYNEIETLRKIASKVVKIKPVDFTKEITSYNPTQPEIWCLIGNPGCGKTFLARRTALRFSCSELSGIRYSISIPCRNPDWHSMETTRYETEGEFDNEFISKWLCLGLPKGGNWSKELAKHLSESEGEGMLLIIDGLDEYTKKVTFEKTLLFLLLTRQILIRASIILTSRPGFWTDISSTHELKIDRHYQVLGFSPENRDLYFTKQLHDDTKLRECMNLLARYDEINQLSLIPVNASLFATLLKEKDSTDINTLTKLYHELTLYLIRRELIRMSLEEFSRVAEISSFHADILKCLYRIAVIAFLGVANRDLVSEENVPLSIKENVYTGHCLGLAHEHYIKESVGLIKKVWTFPHLTMQEFTAAVWLYSSTWTRQCYSIRYISHSFANFALFRMVVRFLCGLIRDKSAAVLSILYRYLTPQPIQLNDIPMCYQLRYDDLDTHNEGWNEFTDNYLQMTAILYETDSSSIPVWFAHFKQFFPDPIYLFILKAISPNEWICFLQSLKLVSKIQLISINTKFINLDQFKSLLQCLGICSVKCLAIKINDKDLITDLPYCDLIRETEQLSDTRISLEIFRCDLTGVTADNSFLKPKNLSSMQLFRLFNYSNESQRQLTNHFSALEYLYIAASRNEISFKSKNAARSGIDYNTLISALCELTQLKGLYLYAMQATITKPLRFVLPQFSKLQEIEFSHYALLPAIRKLTNITYLVIGDHITSDETLSNHLIQVMNGNRITLRGLKLFNLDNIGFKSWKIFLNCLAFCTSIVKLELVSTKLPTDGITEWSNTIRELKSLVELKFYYIYIYDTGFFSLCEGLIKHPVFRKLNLDSCNITSLSCLPLIHLIPTVSKLENLRLSGLWLPEQESVKALTAVADEYGIEHDLWLHFKPAD